MDKPRDAGNSPRHPPPAASMHATNPRIASNRQRASRHRQHRHDLTYSWDRETSLRASLDWIAQMKRPSNRSPTVARRPIRKPRKSSNSEIHAQVRSLNAAESQRHEARSSEAESSSEVARSFEHTLASKDNYSMLEDRASVGSRPFQSSPSCTPPAQRDSSAGRQIIAESRLDCKGRLDPPRSHEDPANPTQQSHDTALDHDHNDAPEQQETISITELASQSMMSPGAKPTSGSRQTGTFHEAALLVLQEYGIL